MGKYMKVKLSHTTNVIILAMDTARGAAPEQRDASEEHFTCTHKHRERERENERPLQTQRASPHTWVCLFGVQTGHRHWVRTQTARPGVFDVTMLVKGEVEVAVLGLLKNSKWLDSNDYHFETSLNCFWVSKWVWPRTFSTLKVRIFCVEFTQRPQVNWNMINLPTKVPSVLCLSFS